MFFEKGFFYGAFAVSIFSSAEFTKSVDDPDSRVPKSN